MVRTAPSFLPPSRPVPAPCPAGGSPGSSQAHSSAPRRSRASMRADGRQRLPAELQASAPAATCALGSSRPPGRGGQGVYQAPARLPPPALPRAPTPDTTPRSAAGLRPQAGCCPHSGTAPAPLTPLPKCRCWAPTSPAPHVYFHFSALLRFRKRVVSQLLGRNSNLRGGVRG